MLVVGKQGNRAGRYLALAVVLAMVMALLPAGLARAAERELADIGLTWTTRASEGAWLHGAAQGAGLIVAVGEQGEVRSSADGSGWARQSSGTATNLAAVAFGSSTFVAVGRDGTVLTGTGRAWSPRNSGVKAHLNDVAFARGLFVAVGDDGTVLTSPDGAVWTARSAGTRDKLYSVTFGNGQFVAVGAAGTVLTSPDGTVWTARSAGTSRYLSGVAYGNGRYMAVGESDTVLTSADGVTWSHRTVSGAGPYGLWAVAFGDGQFVAVGGMGHILTTTDGGQWYRSDNGKIFTLLDGVEFVGGQFVALGNFGTIRTSGSGPLRPATDAAIDPQVPQTPPPPAEPKETPAPPSAQVDVRCESGKVTGGRRQAQVAGITIEADGGARSADGKETFCGNISINQYLRLNGTLTYDAQALKLDGNGTLYIETPLKQFAGGVIELYQGAFEVSAVSVLKKTGASKFQLNGWPVEITDLRLVPDGISLSGKLTISTGIGFKVDDPVKVEGLQIVRGVPMAISLELPDLKIPGMPDFVPASNGGEWTNLLVEGVQLKIDLQKDDLTVKGKVSLGDTLPGMEGVVGIEGGKLDRLGLGVQGFQIPIDGSGFFIYRLYGEVDGLLNPSRMKIKAATGISGGPKIGDFAVILAEDLALEVDMAGAVQASGKLKLVDVIELDSLLEWNLAEKYVLIKGEIEAFEGMIEGTNELKVTPSTFWGETTGTVMIPKKVKGIGGITVVNSVLAIDPKGFNGKLKVWNFEPTCQVEWDGDFDCDLNWYPLKSFFGYMPLVAATNGEGLAQLPTVTMPAGKKQVVLSVTWNAGDADFTLVSPSGKTLTPDSLGGPDVAWYNKNPELREVVYVLNNPEPGTWHINAAAKGATTYEVELYEILPDPTFALTAPAAGVSGGPVTIRWQTDAAPGSKVNLYYARNETELGTQFAAGLDASLGSYVWSPLNLPSGTYIIYGTVDNGKSAPVKAVAPGKVTTVNPNTPAVPRGVTATAANGKLKVSWLPNTEPSLSGYRIRISDQETRTVGLLSEVTLDSLPPGKTYQIAVSAVTEIGLQSEYSAPVSVFLPASRPPAVQLTWQTPELTNAKESSLQLTIESGATGTVYRNGEAVVRNLTGTTTARVPLESGRNELRLVVTGAGPDTFEERREVYSDQIPPQLIVSGLAPTMTVNAPVLLIAGSTELTARLTLNKQPVRVRPDGSFAVAVPLKAGANQVELVAQDKAGNTMGYYGTITSTAGLASCGARFPDVAGGHSACAAVEQLAALKVLSGYPDGTFQPNRSVTRAEFAKMLVAALGRAPAPRERLAFADAATHWSATSGYLQVAVALGAISGFPDGTFQPDAPVTRAQVIKIAAAAAGLQAAGRSPYSDAQATDWFDGWAAVAAGNGLIGSKAATPIWTGAALSGNQPATRAEAAMVLANLLAPVK